jgi:magnesium transporter
VLGEFGVYVDGKRRSGRYTLDGAWRAAKQEGGFVWLDLHDPTPEEFDIVQTAVGLHELFAEAVIHGHQRPKLEMNGDIVLFVLKGARYVDSQEVVELAELALLAGPNFVVAVERGPACNLGGVRREIEHRPDILARGPGAVLYAIVDQVVDDYIPVIEGVDNDIQELEEEVFSTARTTPVERIYLLKREVLQFHQAAAPLADPLDRLARGRVSPFSDGLEPYFRDVHDHLQRVVARIDTFRDLLTSVLEAALAQVGVRQNEDMRRISAWVAIAAVPTLVAGLYGMNFDYMPELRWTYGYPMVLAGIAAICLLLYRAFRRNGWL